MKQIIFKLALAVTALLDFGNFACANDPGGGTNGIGVNVTLTDNGSSITLANENLSATISKSSGEITSLIYLGVQTVQQSGGNIYYSMDGGTDFRRLNGCAYVIKTNSSDMVDVSFRQTWSTQPQAFDIELHWVLRRGDSGLYAYALLDHPASYPDTRVTEWRMVWKLPGDLLEQIYVDDLRHWQQPSIADINAAEATSIAEIVKLTTGVRAGHYDGKYQYAAEYENIGTWGHASNVRKIGTWIVTGNYEYFNDGPTKNDLCNDWEYQLIHFGRNHYTTSPASDTHGTNGIAWQKIYGPFLLYCNTNSAGGDALWADAKAQVQAEHVAWPYVWLTDNVNYPQADQRGAVSGRFLVNDTYKPSLSTSNAWVGLTATNVDWQFDADHYQYWIRAAADGSFSIQNVRPGLYTLHAFTDGEMNEYALSNVVVTANSTNTLGDLTWNVPHAGNYLLWEIGVPNRTANEYRHGSSNYYEGFIWDTFAGEFPNPIEYNVGLSDWSKDLNYVHDSYKVNGVRNPWTWRLNFFLTSVPPSGNATLNFAFASEHGASLNVYVNNEASTFATISVPTPPLGGNALVRQAIHAKYYSQQISIPVSNLRVGSNTISLIMPSTSSDQNHFMYDAINLELPSKPPLPSNFDLSWSGGLAANVWDIGTTANWSSNTTARVFNNGNRVLFDDLGLNNPPINLIGTLQPANVTVFAMKNFIFDGNGSLSGTMTLAKAGPGALIINNTNTFTGATDVTNGTLIVNGSLNQSPVTIHRNATLGGTGKLGNGVTLQSTAMLRPAMDAPGTIVISNALVLSGRTTNFFDLSDDPSGTTKISDLIKLTGDLTAIGTNYFVINPLNGILGDGVYPLIQYSGSLTGALKNFAVRGVVGKPFAVTNPPGMIALVIISNRPPTIVVWKGGLSANLWNQSGVSNWLNGATLDVFAFDDSVTFDNTGSTSPAVNLSGDLNAASVTVNASVDYTFSGSGSIVGDGGLTKLNSGTLTILATNEFAGPTSIGGGVLAVNTLPNGDLPSPIGASSSDSSNLVFQSGATLRYLGTSVATDRGATLGAGGGTIEVTNPLANLTFSGALTGAGGLTKIGPGTFTLGGSNDYSGGTLISAGILQMGAGANSGTLGLGNVTNNSILLFSRADTVTIIQPISGSGIVVKSGGGTVILANQNSYTGGTTNAQGVLIISNNAALGSGPLNFIGTSGSVQLADGMVVTNAWNTTATVDLMLDCPNGIGTWAGPVSVSSGGSFRPGTSTGNGTVVYAGTANMGGANFIVPRGNFVVASNGIISAGGTVCAIGRSTSGSVGTTLVARDNANLTFGSGLQFGGAQASPGTMTLTIQDNAIVSMGVNNFNLHNSTSTSAKTVLNLNGGTLTVGGFTKSQTGANQTAVINFNGGTLKASTFTAAFLPVLTGETNMVQVGGAIIDDGGFSIAIAGQLSHDPTLGSTPDGGLTKLGAGTLTLAAADSYTGPTFINAGVLTLYAPPIGSISNSASIYIASGALLDFSLGGTASMTLGNGKKLWGNGSVKGSFTAGNGATIAPGSNSIGTLTFSNSLTLASGSTNIFEISHSPLTNDVEKIFGALTNGGTLIVTNISGNSLAAGDNFRLFDAASYAGGFAKVGLPSLSSGLAWNTNALNTNGTISVVAMIPPVFNSLNFSGGNLVLSGTGGLAGANYYVLSSTNLAQPLSSWTRIATNQFDAAGFNFTNTLNTNSPQGFYLLELP